MATFGIKVFKHHEKRDGTFNVKIRITQERKSAYIDTSHFVTSKRLSKNYEVKDTFILKHLYGTLSDYREAVSRLGSKVNYMDADDIKSFLEKVLRRLTSWHSASSTLICWCLTNDQKPPQASELCVML